MLKVILEKMVDIQDQRGNFISEMLELNQTVIKIKNAFNCSSVHAIQLRKE